MKAFVTGGSGFLGRELIRGLAERGWTIRALARSDNAARTVREAGAEPAAGDLDDDAALGEGMRGADAVFHAAACTDEWAPWERFHAINVLGTERALAAARKAGVRRFLHVGTEAALLDGSPLVRVDETRPLPGAPIGHYPRSKALAEKAVLAANGGGLETVVIRPRFIWGKGDTSLLPKLVERVKAGQFSWIDHGRPLTSTCHVRNVVQGALLAAERGAPGGVYFLTDGEPTTVREMLGALLGTQGVDPGERSVPFAIARAGAAAAETVWKLLHLKGLPPATRTAVLLIGQEVTVVDSRARRELGYAPEVTRERGLAELSGR